MEVYNDPHGTASGLGDLLQNLSDRAQHLLDELKLFQSALCARGKQDESEFRVFRRGVQSEIKSLQTIQKRRFTQTMHSCDDGVQTEDELNCAHALKSSNLPFYEAVWETAKTCHHITGLGRRVHIKSIMEHSDRRIGTMEDEKHSAVVDIVADNGLKWIKVSTVNNKRLLFEMAKQGWENYGDYSSDEEDIDEKASPSVRREDLISQLELVKLAENLIKAARMHRVRFKHPEVHFVLPNVYQGEYDDVDALLHDLRATGVILSTNSGSFGRSSISQSVIQLNTSNVTSLLPTSNSVQEHTEVLNLDCTILLALISDISHVSQANLPARPPNRSGTYHKAILRQIESETQTPLLPDEMYGLLKGRELHCTSHAAERMFKIADTMGTDSEKQRAAIFFGQGIHRDRSVNQLQKDLIKVSCHATPIDLNLPIQIVDFDDLSSVDAPLTQFSDLKLSDTSRASVPDIKMSSLDRKIAQKITGKVALSKINTSVFLYGWTRGIVTVTSNRVVATSINKAIDELLDEIELQSLNGGLVESHTRQREVLDPSSRLITSGGYDERIEKHSPSSVSAHVTDEFVGPKIYICETARSLIGKERQVHT